MEKLYCFTLDDNIRFMEKACLQKASSLFQTPYLAMLRRQNERFGCKFQLNMFYSYYPGSFSLADVPDIYRKEMEENFDWFKFSFHARHNEPAFPYEKDAELLEYDFEAVTSQLRRIAGPDALANTTTIHYASATQRGCTALRGRGVRGLVGMFYEKPGRDALNYYLTEEAAAGLRQGYFFYDALTDLTFVHNDIILNQHDIRETEIMLGNILKDVRLGTHAPFIQLMTHEQYFYDDYPDYQPDFEEKLHLSLQMLHQNGYRPVFLEEALQRCERYAAIEKRNGGNYGKKYS